MYVLEGRMWAKTTAHDVIRTFFALLGSVRIIATAIAAAPDSRLKCPPKHRHLTVGAPPWSSSMSSCSGYSICRHCNSRGGSQKSMLSTSEMVRPDVREFGVSGRPVGRRNCRLGVPAWTSGVDGHTVLSCRPASSGLGRVCFNAGLKEEPKYAPSEWVTQADHNRGIIFVEVLLPRRTPLPKSSDPSVRARQRRDVHRA
jgi:hypothetical protein